MKKGRRPVTRIIRDKSKGRVININQLIGKVNISGPLKGAELEKALAECVTKTLRRANCIA